MKLFPKVKRPYRLLLSCAVIFGALGLALSCAGWVMGGSSRETNPGEVIESGPVDVNSVEVDVDAGYVYVRPGDGYSVTASGISARHFTYEINEGTLKVEYDVEGVSSLYSFASGWRSPTVTVTVPAGGSVDIDVGAGMISAEGVDARYSSFEVGAGSVWATMSGLESDCRVEADVAAGSLYLDGRTVEGFRRAYLSSPAELSRSLSVRVGAGEAHIDFEAGKTDNALGDIAGGAQADDSLQTAGGGAGGGAQLGNPFTEYASFEEARAAVGFDFSVPTSLPDDFVSPVYTVMQSNNAKFAQAAWQIDGGDVLYRMGLDDDNCDLDGDYNDYPLDYEMTIEHKQVDCEADDSGIRVAKWDAALYDYCIMSDRGLTGAELEEIVGSIE